MKRTLLGLLSLNLGLQDVFIDLSNRAPVYLKYQILSDSHPKRTHSSYFLCLGLQFSGVSMPGQ